MLSKFTCLADLDARFVRSSQNLKLQIGHRLASVCLKFVPASFEEIVRCYIMLGEVRWLCATLQNKYPSEMENVVTSTITNYVRLSLSVTGFGAGWFDPDRVLCMG